MTVSPLPRTLSLKRGSLSVSVSPNRALLASPSGYVREPLHLVVVRQINVRGFAGCIEPEDHPPVSGDVNRMEPVLVAL